MAITDLSGTTWHLNTTLDLSSISLTGDGNLAFTSNNYGYNTLHISASKIEYALITNRDVIHNVYSATNGWSNEAYRTIAISGGSAATNASLIEWLIANSDYEPEKFVNKVIFGEDVLIDLTSDTVDAEHLADGYTAHAASGELITGTMSGGRVATYYATCSTAASTAAKVITVSDWTPTAGDILGVLFTTANTAATPTLKVNSLSTASIMLGTVVPNSTTNTLQWSANTFIVFMFDGTYYRYIYARTAAGTIAPDGAGSWSAICSTGASVAAKTCTATNFRLTPGARISIDMENANTVSNPTLNINSTGAYVIEGLSDGSSGFIPVIWDEGDMITVTFTGSVYKIVNILPAYPALTNIEIDTIVSSHGTSLPSSANGVNF